MAAAATWSQQSGIQVNVIAAQNLVQQVSQGMAANDPPDVFYLDTSSFQNYAKTGALFSYGNKVSNPNDFFPALKASFTYNNQFYCAPKDWSTLALVVNSDDWTKAGLTEADVPTTWDQLAAVSKKLTTGGRVGLTVDPTHSGLDEFLLQNGGTLISDDKKSAALDSPQNVQALTYVKGLLTSGVLKFPSTLGAGWNGEAFGKNKAAMTIVGNWIDGAMKADFPKVNYKVYPLPAGPSGVKATNSFTNCWAIPAKSANQANAVKLVDFLTSVDRQGVRRDAFAGVGESPVDGGVPERRGLPRPGRRGQARPGPGRRHPGDLGPRRQARPAGQVRSEDDPELRPDQHHRGHPAERLTTDVR